MNIEQDITPAGGASAAPSFYRDFLDKETDFNGKVILVTGGTGSFGRHFLKQVVSHYTPKRLIVFSRDEMKQYELAQEFPTDRYPFMRYFIGDVRNAERLEMAMRGVDYVIHAAAMKHVSIAEYNPFECIHTNVMGAENVVRAAIGAGVKRVIALSTDKAANPINLYGASKLASDKIFIAANNLSGGNGCRFSVVRYGNVIGSRGSVLTYFQKLIEEGAPELPITDARMTRFWITLTQGVNFVLSCLPMMRGGEIFVPKIPSMLITEFAIALAPTLKHKVIGIRPGEKIHEVMISSDDARTTVDLGDRYVIQPAFAWWSRPTGYKNAKKVAEDFVYSSDRNDEWMGREDLRHYLKDIAP
ncbi:MAG: UDP-N-acetylglucosamine 4,6-dehydratase (inverting) [Oceanibaculum nanhaiense]|uniref:UDP-N-acetylglucosamine 4,6-dehydratase (inverting) n=1 Tax=Oceanibaculum nanhaiense TaxID=1909734 RepID=UPI0025A40361|nr:UDP-N-acetylglucosamine 4,6-dehydratase (inverting) [Oceanibaculum nanhaiense]MDM7947764.1 UDP-N-acetylglucosamine 4,6-dehydratase (inverting) [Oceanibaculum nanhaiense]